MEKDANNTKPTCSADTLTQAEKTIIIKAKYIVQLTLDFPGGYPGELNNVKELMQRQFGLKALPTVKNIICTKNRVILAGVIDNPMLKNEIKIHSNEIDKYDDISTSGNGKTKTK